MKSVLDRTNPFFKITMSMNGDEVIHDKVVDLSAKKNVIITGCGFPYYPDNYTSLKLQMANIFEAPTIICIYETTLLIIPIPTLNPLKNNLLTSFTKAGREFSKDGYISDATMQILEKPMLPSEIYINLINNLKKQ